MKNNIKIGLKAPKNPIKVPRLPSMASRIPGLKVPGAFQKVMNLFK